MNRKQRRQNKTAPSPAPKKALRTPAQQQRYDQAMALAAQGNHLEASEIFTQLMQENPNDLAAAEQMGLCMVQLGKHHEAITFFETLIKINPSRAKQYNLGIGLACTYTEDYARALELLEGSLDLIKTSGVMRSLAVCALYLGDKPKTEHYFQRAMDLAPDDLRTRYEYLRHCVKFSDQSDSAYQDLITSGQSIDPSDKELRTAYHYTMFKALDDLGEPEKAIDHALQGASILKDLYNYSMDSFEEFTDISLKFYDEAIFKQYRGTSKATTETPVFICAMPRSGTSLLEQILGSHPDIAGIGEDGYFMTQVASRAYLYKGDGTPFPLAKNEKRIEPFLPPENIGKLYETYLQRRCPSAKRVINKAINNYAAVGYYHFALPKARFIHIKRDAVDSCLSTFTQYFSDGVQKYTYDFETIARRYRCYVTLMEHWNKLMPERIFNLTYEELVKDTEGMARKLIDFLGLPWDDRCLEFHKQKSVVKTASVNQVRQPIYKSSVARWKKYGPAVKPLIEALGDLASEEAQAYLKE